MSEKLYLMTRFSLPHLIASLVLIELADFGASHIPFGWFGRAAVGDALSRAALIFFASPLVVMISALFIWHVLRRMHTSKYGKGFALRLLVYSVIGLALAWLFNYLTAPMIFLSIPFQILLFAPAVIVAVAAQLAALISLKRP